MKRYYFLIITILLVSCSSEFLDIDPKGTMYAESFYATGEELEMAVTGLYWSFQDWSEYSDDMVCTVAGNDKGSTFPNWQEIDVFDAESDNTELGLNWSDLYILINSCNEILENYEDADASDAIKEVCAAQAHFFRAMAYFHLVRIYKMLPLVTSSSDAVLDLELTDSEEIYDLIISDLKNAETYLPDNWDDDSKRAGVAVTNGAAKSLLAYVYLCEAGYPVNKDGAYALAAEKSKEVIDNANIWGYKLMENIEDLYSHEYNYENKSCDEVVLASYTEDGYGCVKASMPAEYGGWEVYYAEINFFENYPECARKDAIFMSDFPQEDGTFKHYTELASKHPYYKQYWDGDENNIDMDALWNGCDWDNGRPQMLLTHANTLLVYAEAKAMSSGVDATAEDALNQVRNRAGLPDITSGLDAEAFRDSVVQERSYEFCGGFMTTAPWYDLVRLERVEESIADRNELENEIVNPITKRRYFSPYPYNDYAKNPNLTWGTW